MAMLLCDGAYGTMLMGHGTPAELLNITHPQLVEELHSQYISAGAGIIITNTFGANAALLAAYGVAHRAGDINRAAVEIARRSALGKAHVVASVAAPWVGTTPQKLVDVYGEQIRAFAQCGVRDILIETVSYPDAIGQLVDFISAVYQTPLRIGVSFSPVAAGKDGGAAVSRCVEQLRCNENVTAVGVNCGDPDAESFTHIYNVVAQSYGAPLFIRPSADAAPEMWARKACDLALGSGAWCVGGCCGTTPAHISALRCMLK